MSRNASFVATSRNIGESDDPEVLTPLVNNAGVFIAKPFVGHTDEKSTF
jgi:hypothetical protein